MLDTSPFDPDPYIRRECTRVAEERGHPEWAPLPTSADEARFRNVTRYFTGIPCRQGHIAPRRAYDTLCLACHPPKERAKAAPPKPKRVKRAVAAPTHSALHKRNANARARDAAWDMMQKVGNAAPPWLNRDHKEAIFKVYLQAATLTDHHGTQYHVDHVVPLNHPDVCGLHVSWNLQVLTAAENIAKSNAFDGTMLIDGW